MPSNDNRYLSAGRVRQPGAQGVRSAAKKSNPLGDESEQAPVDPKANSAPTRDTRDSPAPNPDGCTEGTAPLTPKPLRDPFAKRRSDAPRQTGVTPHLTGKTN